MREELTQFLRRVPFVPFVVTTRDGQVCAIETVERMSVGKNACTIVNAEGIILYVPFHAIDHVSMRDAPAGA
ncbi:MAG: hypothetical protein JO015_22075 [Verrucomicrobia bacterium]|nr:hypothetical protein [Verrucomicrobiota bacterium]